MKIGDKVKSNHIIYNWNSRSIPVGTMFEVTDGINDDQLAIFKTIEGNHDFEGMCSKSFFDLITTNNTMTNTVNLETVAFDLIAKNGSTTTLDVKEALKAANPSGTYFQTEISNDMNQMFVDGKLSWTFNGTYRIYTLPVAPTNSVVSKECTRTELAEQLNSFVLSKETIAVTFDNKKGETIERTGVLGHFSPMGYRQMTLSDGEIRNIDPRRVSKIVCGNKIWTLKSK